MLISEATFGAVDKGHAIIASTSGATKVAPRIVGRTDLPNTVPSGVEWTSFDSGYFEGDIYVLSRTWPDPDAPRAGMVFTHAVMAPFSEVDDPDGLTLLAAALAHSPDRGAVLGHQSRQPPGMPTTSELAPHLLDALMNESRLAPIVWLGEGNLLTALTVLWRYLPSAVRRSITFRLSFGPEDVAAAAPLIVTTPRQLAQRWKGRTIIDPAQGPGAPSKFAQDILTPSSASDISAYSSAFSVSARPFGELGLLQKSWEISKNRGREFGTLLAQLRFIMALSPERRPGDANKAALVRELAGTISSASAVQVYALRNINLENWECGAVLWEALRNWAEQAAASETDDPDDIAIWRYATAESAQSAWAIAVRGGFEDSVANAGKKLWHACWRRWEAAPDLVAPLFALIQPTISIQDALVQTAPATIGGTLAESIMRASARRKWWVLHAIVARRSNTLSAALERQLAVDSDENHIGGLAALFEDLPTADIISSALHVNNARLTALAGAAAGDDPTLLASFDPGVSAWRRIWSVALGRNPRAWQGVADQDSVRIAMVQQLRTGTILEPEFLEQIALTPMANLAQIHDRSFVWDVLPATLRDRFLTATARGWIVDFVESERTASDADAALRRAVTSAPIRDEFIATYDARVDPILRYFEAFEEVPEHVATAWLRKLRDRHASIGQDEATRLGTLARDRNWHNVASVVAAMLHTDGLSGLAPAAITMRGIFHMMDLGMLMIRGFLAVSSPQDVWAVFEEIACELYPSGPNEIELWSRAGGKKADLPDGHTGRARWHMTIALLRNGGSQLAPFELLKTMIQDHPRNEKLSWILQQDQFKED